MVMRGSAGGGGSGGGGGGSGGGGGRGSPPPPPPLHLPSRSFKEQGDARLKCFVSMTLSNVLSHVVLAKTFLLHPEALDCLVALIMRVPSPR